MREHGGFLQNRSLDCFYINEHLIINKFFLANELYYYNHVAMYGMY